MTLRGVVIEGKKLGRRLGFPTANIMLSDDMSLANGVYLSRVEINGVEYCALSNIGCNPTVGGELRRMESYILDFEGDLYGCELEFELGERLRDEMTFDSIEDLTAQVLRDIEMARGYSGS